MHLGLLLAQHPQPLRDQATGRSKVAYFSDQTGLMRSPGRPPPSWYPGSSLSLRNLHPCHPPAAHGMCNPKTAYSQFNKHVLERQITQPCRLIQHNSHGICPQTSRHHHIMCTDIYKPAPQEFTHTCIFIQRTDACAHRSCADTKPHVHVHMFIPTRQTYTSISHDLGTHICSVSYTTSSPNKNFIHCSQIQY